MRVDICSAFSELFSEVSYRDFYRDIFPEGSFEQKGVFEKGVYNGIAVSISPGDNKTKRFTVTDDLEVIDNLAKTDDFCIMSPISYAGKARKSSNARYMYALAIDLDGVKTQKQLDFFLLQISRGDEMLSFIWGLPKPTYLVSSGTGIHLYFVFDEPVPLYPSLVEQLEVLKERLTWQAWTQGASELSKQVQYESLFQGFRMVGTITKNGKRCRAFKYGDKVNLEYLNSYVPDEYRVKQLNYSSSLSLEEAKAKYPEWYERRVIQGRKKGTWTASKAVYDWWLARFRGTVEVGHRYWCVMTLATYAKKCGVDLETLERDAYGLVDELNSLSKEDPFTADDVLHALQAYDDSYITYPIDTIVTRTGIPIEKNKRNGRKQSLHLKLARANRDILCEERGKVDWREGNGRPDKAKIVEDWRKENPDGTKAECIRATGLSKPTVLKWWDGNKTVS